MRFSPLIIIALSLGRTSNFVVVIVTAINFMKDQHVVPELMHLTESVRHETF